MGQYHLLTGNTDLDQTIDERFIIHVAQQRCSSLRCGQSLTLLQNIANFKTFCFNPYSRGFCGLCRTDVNSQSAFAPCQLVLFLQDCPAILDESLYYTDNVVVVSDRHEPSRQYGFCWLSANVCSSR
jgi:hypothetical protein